MSATVPAEPPRTPEVIVIGGGPGGSSAAARLALAGRSVLLLERAVMPRFHIGESLIPGAVPMLEKLGVVDQIRAEDFPPKHGAEFCSVFGFTTRIPFDAQGGDRHPHAYNVERACFDRILLEAARAYGATVLEEAHVEGVLMDGDRAVGVRYRHGGVVHEARAPYVIDAAGRASHMSRMYGLRRKIEQLRMVAVFRHFGEFDEANHLGVAGDLQIGQHRDGWVWAIPIRSDVISIGAVMPEAVYAGGKPEDLLASHLVRLKRITQRIRGSVPISGVRVARDYSYFSDTITGPGWLMVGDSACFMDPLFSAGVTLALSTGVQAAEAVDAMLDAPDAEPELCDRYTRFVKTGYDTYARLIQSYYSHNYSLLPLMTAAGIDVRRGHVTDNKYLVRLMSGDFWGPDNTVNAILREDHSMDTFAPFEPLLECPNYGPGVAETSLADAL